MGMDIDKRKKTGNKKTPNQKVDEGLIYKFNKRFFIRYKNATAG